MASVPIVPSPVVCSAGVISYKFKKYSSSIYYMCGIYGIFSSHLTNLNLNGVKKLQHRGQDGWGVGYFNKSFVVDKGFGKVPDIEKSIVTTSMIGHVRYCTSGDARNIAPVFHEYYSQASRRAAVSAPTQLS